jgi:hypothetical protein
MSDEIAKRPVDPTQFPEAAHKHARRALREHQRAERDAVNAVQHAVKSGEALLKAYDLCEYGQWRGFFEMHFQSATGQKLSLRTAGKYMQLARNWSLLSAQNPAGVSSQRQALKALTAIVQADEADPPDGTCAARGASARVARPGCAARGASATKPARNGPVWRASGPFVQEALSLINSLDMLMSNLVADGYGLAEEAATVHSAATRLKEMLDKDLDEAEAQQAAGQWMWVIEREGQASGGTESGAAAPTPALPRREREQMQSEVRHDN